MMGRVAALVGVAVLGAASPLYAGEDDRALSVSLSYGRFDIDDDEVAPDGAVLGVDYERGLSDAVALRVSAGGGLYCDACWAWSGHATVGLTYVLDILKYVPYANIGIGGIVVGGEQVDNSLHPIVELGAGLDILVSRDWSWGVLARFEYFPQDTAFFTAGARITWRWGFF